MILTVTPNPALDKFYWVERLRRDPETPLTRAFRSLSCPGGKGLNVAILLARLGADVVATGFVAGHTGQVIASRAREEGITTNFIWTDGETRTNVIVLERGQEARPLEVNESGPPISPVAQQQFLRTYQRLLTRARWVVLGGSLPPGLIPDFYKELIALAREHGVPTAINAAGAALEEALPACPTLVKPDTRERRELLGRALDGLETMVLAARQILDYGVQSVVISHEVTHDLVVTPEGLWDLEARDVRFANLVGAEDALVAGMVYKLCEGASLEEAAVFGMAAATASAECPEPLPPDREAVERALPRIRMVRL